MIDVTHFGNILYAYFKPKKFTKSRSNFKKIKPLHVTSREVDCKEGRIFKAKSYFRLIIFLTDFITWWRRKVKELRNWEKKTKVIDPIRISSKLSCSQAKPAAFHLSLLGSDTFIIYFNKISTKSSSHIKRIFSRPTPPPEIQNCPRISSTTLHFNLFMGEKNSW